MTGELLALERLARASGVLCRYLDVDGESVAARPETLVAILRALGHDLARVGDAPAALDRQRAAAAAELAPAVRVLWDESPSVLWLRPPEAEPLLELELHLESGARSQWQARPAPFATRERRGVVRYVTRLELPALPHGYHGLEVRTGGASHHVRLVRAPTRSYRREDTGRRWGVFAPVYALHSRASSGLGSFVELGRLAEAIGRLGGGFVATLPFYAQVPGELSPYSPSSRLFWNELYVDAGERPPAPTPDPIDFAASLAAQRRELEARWSRERATLRERVARFAERRPEVLDFARFVADAEGRDDDDAAAYHVYVQWLAETQLEDAARRGAPLYLDLPLGVHRDGYDVARYRGLFADAIDVGAPPDAAFPAGQNWSFPPILPAASRRRGHDYFRSVLQHSMRQAALLRVDHVMGLHRQFWIPRGEGPEAGTYVRFPAEELYAVLSLESHRARCEIVGEDLGIVPDVVRERMAAHAMRGLYVSQLSAGAPVEHDAVASLNTHDTATHAGAGGDEASLERELRRLVASPAALVNVALEDLWLESEPQNVPGTSLPERRNWSRPLRFGIEEIEERYGARLRELAR